MSSLISSLQKMKEGQGWLLEVHLDRLSSPQMQEKIRAFLKEYEKEKYCTLFHVEQRLFLFFAKAHKDDMHALMLKTRFLSNLLSLAENQEICTVYQMENDKAFLEKLFEAEAEKGLSPILPIFDGEKTPLNANLLAQIETALKQADISPFLRKQPICLCVGKAPPLPMMEEIYVSLSDLKKKICPFLDIYAEPWLFGYWMEMLDGHVLEYLSKQTTFDKPLALNLAVRSVLKEPFTSFDAKLSARDRKNIHIELKLPDILSDMTAFKQARAYLKQKGYSIMLDQVSVGALDLLDGKMFGADKVKLWWEPIFYKKVMEPSFLKKIKKMNPSKIILCHVDDKKVLTVGEALGIKSYQGYAIQKLLFKASTPTFKKGKFI